ncbi:hypothetical protein [Caulobacter sp. CCG-8]|uniref:hypothetical protein n=2 Tax=unclassified Caulobacter TaxID=2648921 RepID=UPI00307DEBE2
MDRQRLLGLALCAAALVLIVWGLSASGIIRIDFPPAERAPAKPKPVTISIDGRGGVSVRDGAPDQPAANAAPGAKR